jgi:hypothetical protein
MPSPAPDIRRCRVVSALVVEVAFLAAASHSHLWSDHAADQLS